MNYGIMLASLEVLQNEWCEVVGGCDNCPINEGLGNCPIVKLARALSLFQYGESIGKSTEEIANVVKNMVNDKTMSEDEKSLAIISMLLDKLSEDDE